MATLFDTNTLVLTVQDLLARNPVQFLLDLVFKQTAMSETEVVTIDVKKGRRVMAPLVIPTVAGKVMQAQAKASHTIKPAYVKAKFVVQPSETIKRIAGEPLFGALSRQQRLDAITLNRLQDGIAYCDRRMEIMAADALVNGTVTLEGEEYPRTVIDFQRDAALTGWAPTTEWDETNNAPLDDLDTVNSLMISKSGLGITDVIFDPKSWGLFRKNGDVSKLLQNFPAQQNAVQVNAGGLNAEGGQFMGQIGMWRLWQYQSYYIDPLDNTQKQALPDWTVLPINIDGVLGVRHYGAIEDLSALNAVPYFPKVWEDDDPSVRYAMIQSAPLVSLERPDASASMTVSD